MRKTAKEMECCLSFSCNTSTLTHFGYYAIVTMLEKDMFPLQCGV